MLKKILWLVAGSIGAKIFNDLCYSLLNTPGEGVVVWKAFFGAIPATLFLVFCAIKGNIFYDYQKKLGTKLKQTYKFLIIIFGLLMLCMVVYFFSNSTSTSPKIFSSTKSVSYFTCSSYVDASSCSGSCKVSRQVELDFKIDKTRNIVLKTAYEDNKIIQQRALEKCVVVDESNWICSDTMIRDRFFSEVRESMNNGKYYFFSADTIEGGDSFYSCTR